MWSSFREVCSILQAIIQRRSTCTCTDLHFLIDFHVLDTKKFPSGFRRSYLSTKLLRNRYAWAAAGLHPEEHHMDEQRHFKETTFSTQQGPPWREQPKSQKIAA